MPKHRSGRLSHFECYVQFADGSSMGWTGTPWGSRWESFKRIMDYNEVESVAVNFDGDFWQ